MLRRAWNLLCALSLLLCVAVVVLWLVSYRDWVWLGYGWRISVNSDAASSVQVGFESGSARFILSRGEAVGISNSPFFSPFSTSINLGWTCGGKPRQEIVGPGNPDLWGFEFSRLRPTSGHGIWLCRLPCWSLTLLLAILPSLRLYLLIRHGSQNQTGLCPACSYDLRASKDRCPECGRETGVKL